jgi:hypothetical protein
MRYLRIIADCGLRIADLLWIVDFWNWRFYSPFDPRSTAIATSAIANQSAISTSTIVNKSAIRNPQSAIRNPQYRVLNPRCEAPRQFPRGLHEIS